MEVVEAPRASVPFSLEPILVKLEEGRYISPILPASLADLVAGRRPAGGIDPRSNGVSGSGGGSGGGNSGSGGGGSGNKKYRPSWRPL